MEVFKLGEEGQEFALYGMSLSFMEEGTPISTWWDEHKFEQMKKLAPKQAHRDGGHNKFLESMITWWHVKAPRYFWQEADTYRLETKQSASTMHTIQKRALQPSDFEVGTDHEIIDVFNGILFECTDGFVNTKRLSDENLVMVKSNLPEGFLQTRQWRISYMTLRNIIHQRRTHRLPLWQDFIKEILRQVEYPDLLPGIEE